MIYIMILLWDYLNNNYSCVNTNYIVTLVVSNHKTINHLVRKNGCGIKEIF